MEMGLQTYQEPIVFLIRGVELEASCWKPITHLRTSHMAQPATKTPPRNIAKQ
jgi:hypothetical protein